MGACPGHYGIYATGAHRRWVGPEVEQRLSLAPRAYMWQVSGIADLREQEQQSHRNKIEMKRIRRRCDVTPVATVLLLQHKSEEKFRAVSLHRHSGLLEDGNKGEYKLLTSPPANGTPATGLSLVPSLRASMISFFIQRRLPERDGQ